MDNNKLKIELYGTYDHHIMLNLQSSIVLTTVIGR